MYAAQVDGRRLTFSVYGVWRGNMLLRDRETGSIWQQASGAALSGPLQGRSLELLPAWETTWGELLAAYPQAVYACEPERFTGVLPKALLQRLLHITQVASLTGLSAQDRRLQAHALVIGLVVNGEARAYPLAALRAAGEIRDQLGGAAIQLHCGPGEGVSVQTAAGTALPHQRLWWQGWSEFHPRSGIYAEKQSQST